MIGSLIIIVVSLWFSFGAAGVALTTHEPWAGATAIWALGVAVSEFRFLVGATS